MTFAVRCFVAYPSSPAALAETMEQAIDLLNAGGVVQVEGWKSVSIGGKLLVSEILRAIDERDLFIANLTDLNENVLFETGYAIARQKRLWLVLDPTFKQSELLFQRFQLLSTVGYSRYNNSQHIVDAFYREQPYGDLANTLYRATIQSILRPGLKPGLLYLKSAVDTDASVKLTRLVARSPIPPVIDDRLEMSSQTLAWYAQEAHRAYAVLAHVISSYYEGRLLHNAKCAFVCGLAYGMGRRILMLAQSPFQPPLDYRDLAKVHETAGDCEALGKKWLQEVEKAYSDEMAAGRDYAAQVAARSNLQRLNVGDPVAEHEADTLNDYFLKTAAYNEALRARYCVFVGRKGSGKTANLQALAAALRVDRRNHVCVIKPVAYELQGVLRMLRQALDVAEQGFLIESLWKYLIYTELAKTTYEELRARSERANLTADEEALMGYVSSNESVILPDFTVRLEHAVGSLQELDTTQGAAVQRLRISELLHDGVIAHLRGVLGNVLHQRQRVAILLDNLDKAWNAASADLDLLAGLFLGLLGVGNRIAHDFAQSDFWRKPVSLYLTVFLRSDIFHQVMRRAREPDKVPNMRITWEDPEFLLRVIEERFYRSGEGLERPEEVWVRYFAPEVRGVTTREYLISGILPRPRDLIYLAKTALDTAINRGHGRIEEQDVVEAEKRYSQFALESLLVETGYRVAQLEGLLYEFAGSSEIISYGELLKAMAASGIPTELAPDVVDLLVDATFLGLEVEPGRFAYVYNEDEKRKMQIMARKTSGCPGPEAQRFRINRPYHAYLEVKAGVI